MQLCILSLSLSLYLSVSLSTKVAQNEGIYTALGSSPQLLGLGESMITPSDSCKHLSTPSASINLEEWIQPQLGGVDTASKASLGAGSVVRFP